MFNLEMMGAWYPMIVGTIGLIYVGLIYLTASQKMYKTAIVLAVVGGVFTVFGPIKIDGTNTKLNNQITVKERTQEYNAVQEEKKVIHTVKPTFAERMAAENARSLEANKATRSIIDSKQDEVIIIRDEDDAADSEAITVSEAMTIKEATDEPIK